MGDCDVYVRTNNDIIIAEWGGDLTDDCRLYNTPLSDEAQLPAALEILGWTQLCSTKDIIIAAKNGTLYAFGRGVTECDLRLVVLGQIPSWGGENGKDLYFDLYFADVIFSKMVVADEEFTDNSITQVNALQIYNVSQSELEYWFFVI